jgi:dienelactone hydrolase
MKRFTFILISAAALLASAAAAAAVSPPLNAARVAQLRKQICDNFFVPDPLPPLDARIYRTFLPSPGVRAEAVSYKTQFGVRVPAILYLPDPLPKEKIPAFVVVNGHGGDKYSWYSFYTGILFARGGAAVLTYDVIGEGERNIDHKSGTRQHDYIKGGPMIARYLAGLMITDVRQAVSFLEQQPEVDGGRIAAGGYSMGSFVLALAGAVEPRLHACVLVGGGDLDGPGGYWDSSNKKMCQAYPYQSLDFLGDRPAVIYGLHAARGPLLIYNGLGDTVVAIPTHGPAFFNDLRARTIRWHGSDTGIFQTGFACTNCSHRPYWLTRPVVAWLDQQIGFPNWTEKRIHSLPEIKISAWAEQNKVGMDKLYATEEREGGTMALDVGVPGYSTDMLNVLPTSEWEAQKTNFILETWLAATETSAAQFTNRVESLIRNP